MSKPYYFVKNVARDGSEDNRFLTIWDLRESWIFQNDWMLIFFMTFLGIIFEVILIKIYVSFKKKPGLPGNSRSDSHKNEDICLESMALATKTPSVLHPASEENLLCFRVDIFSESTTSTLTSEENQSNFEDSIFSSNENLYTGTSESDYQVNSFGKSHIPFPGGASLSLSLFNSEAKEKFQNHREHSENESEQKSFPSKTLISIMKTNKNKKPEFSSDLSLSKPSKSNMENEDLDMAPLPPAHLFLSRHQVRLLEENVKNRISLKPNFILETKHSDVYPRPQENSQHSVEMVISAQSRNAFPEQTAIQNQGFYDIQFASQAQQFINNQELVNNQPTDMVSYFDRPQDLLVKPLSNNMQGSFQAKDMDKSQLFIKVPCTVEGRDLLKGLESNEFSTLSPNSVVKDMPQLKKIIPKDWGKLASLELSQYSVYSSVVCLSTMKGQKNRKKSSDDKGKLCLKVPSLKAKKTPASQVFQICHTSRNKNELGWKHNIEKEELHLISVSKFIIPYIKKHSRKNLVKVLPDVVRCDGIVKKRSQSSDVEQFNFSGSIKRGMSSIIENLEQYGRENTALQGISSKVLPQFEQSFMVNPDKLTAPYFLLDEISMRSRESPVDPREQACHLYIPEHRISSEGAMSKSQQKCTSSFKMKTHREIKMKEDLRSAENEEELPANAPNLQGDSPKGNVQKPEDLLRIVVEFSDVNLLIYLRPKTQKVTEELQDIKVQTNTERVNLKSKIALSPKIMAHGNPAEHEEFEVRSSVKNMHHKKSPSDAFHDTTHATISETPETEMPSRSSARTGTSTVRLSKSVLKQEKLQGEKETEDKNWIDESSIVQEPQKCDPQEEKQRTLPLLSQDFRFSTDKKKNGKCVRFNMEPINLVSKAIQNKEQQVYPPIPSLQTASRIVPCPMTGQLQIEKVEQNIARPTSRESAIDPVCPHIPTNLPVGEHLVKTVENWVPFGENLREKLDHHIVQEKEDIENDLSPVATGSCHSIKMSGTKSSLNVRQVIRKIKKPAVSRMLYINRHDSSSHRRTLRDRVEMMSDELLNVYPHVSILPNTDTHIRLNAENCYYIKLPQGNLQLDSEVKHLPSFYGESTSQNALEASLQYEAKLMEKAQPKFTPPDSWIFRYDLATQAKATPQGKEATDELCSLTDFNMISPTETERIPNEAQFMSAQGKHEGMVASDDIQESNLQDEDREQQVLLKVVPQSSQHFEVFLGQRKDLNVCKPASQAGLSYFIGQAADPVQGKELKESTQAQNYTIGPAIVKLSPARSEDSLTDDILVDTTTYDTLPDETRLVGVLRNWNEKEKGEFRNDLQATILEPWNLFRSDLPESNRQRKMFTCKALKSKSPSCVIMKVKKPSISKLFNIPQCGCRKYLLPKTLKSQTVGFLNCCGILSDGFYVIVLEAEKQKGLSQELPAILESLTFSTYTSPVPIIQRNKLVLMDKGLKMSPKCVALKVKKAPISQMFRIVGSGTPGYRRPLEYSFKTKIKPGKSVGDVSLNVISSATSQAETEKKGPHPKEKISSIGGQKTSFPKAEESEIGLIPCDTSWDGNLGRIWDGTISEKKSQNQKDLRDFKLLSFSSPLSAGSKSERDTFECVPQNYMSPRQKMLEAKPPEFPMEGHLKKRQHKIKYQEGENGWYASVRESLFSATEDSRSPSSTLIMDKPSFDTKKRDTSPNTTSKTTASNHMTDEKEKIPENIAPNCLRSVDFLLSVLSDSKSKGNLRQVLNNEIIMNLKCLTGKEKKPPVSQMLKTSGYFIIKHKKKFQLNLRSKMKAPGQIKNVPDTFLNTIDFTSDFSDMMRQILLKPEIARRQSHIQLPQAASQAEGLAEYFDSVNKGDTFNSLKEVNLHSGESGGETQKPLKESGSFYTINLTVNVQLIKESDSGKSEDMLLKESSFSQSQICEMSPEINVKLENSKNVQITVKVGLSTMEKSPICAKPSETTDDAASRKYDKKKIDHSVLKETSPYHLAGILDSVDKQLSASQEIKNLADTLKIHEMSSAKVIPSQGKQPALPQSRKSVGHATITIDIKRKQNSRKGESNKAELNANAISTPTPMPTLQNLKMEESFSMLDTSERPSKKRNVLTKAKVGKRTTYKKKVLFKSLPFEFGVVQTRKSETSLINRVCPETIPSQKIDINLMSQNKELKLGEELILEPILLPEIQPIQNEKQNESKAGMWKTTNPKTLVPHEKWQESYIPELIWSSTCAYITTHPKIIRSKDKAETDEVKKPLPIKEKKLKAKKTPVSQCLRFGTRSNKKGRRVSIQQSKTFLLSKNVANLLLESHVDSGCLMSQHRTLAEMKMKQSKLGQGMLFSLKMDQLLDERPLSLSGCVSVSSSTEKLEENIGREQQEYQDVSADLLQCCMQPAQTGSQQTKAHHDGLDFQRKVCLSISENDGNDPILGSISSPLLDQTHTEMPKEEMKGKGIHQDTRFFMQQVNEISVKEYISNIHHMPKNIEKLLLHIKEQEKRKKNTRKSKRLEIAIDMKITENSDTEEFFSKNIGMLEQNDRPELDKSVGPFWIQQKSCGLNRTCHNNKGRTAVMTGSLYPKKVKMKVKKLPVFQLLYVTGHGRQSNSNEIIKEEKNESQQVKTMADVVLNDVGNCGQISSQITAVIEVEGENHKLQKTAHAIPQLNLKTSLNGTKMSSAQIIDKSSMPRTPRRPEQYDIYSKEYQVFSLDIFPRCRDYLTIGPQIDRPYHVKSKANLEREVTYGGVFPKKLEINGNIYDAKTIRTNAEPVKKPLHLEAPKEGEAYISRKKISNLLGGEGLNNTGIFLTSKGQKFLGDLHKTCPAWREHTKRASNPRSVLESVSCSMGSSFHLKQTMNITRRSDDTSINVSVDPRGKEQSELTAIPMRSQRWKVDFSGTPRITQLNICNQNKEKVLESIFSCVLHQFHIVNPKRQVPTDARLNSSVLEKASNEVSIPADPSPCAKGMNPHIRRRKEHQESTLKAFPTQASSSLMGMYQIASPQPNKAMKGMNSQQNTSDAKKKNQKEKHKYDHLPQPASHSREDLLQITYDYSTRQTRKPLRKMDVIDEYSQKRKHRQNDSHLPSSYDSIRENRSCFQNYPCHWPHLMPQMKEELSEEGHVSNWKKGLELCFKNRARMEGFVPSMSPRQMKKQNTMLPLEACSKTIKYWNTFFSKGNQSSNKPQVIETILNSNSPKIRITKKEGSYKAKEKQIEVYVPRTVLHFLSTCMHLWNENKRQKGGLKEGVMKGIRWSESQALKSEFSDIFGANDCDIPSNGLEIQWNIRDKIINIKQRHGDQDWVVTKICEPIPSLPCFQSNEETTGMIISNNTKRTTQHMSQKENGAKAVEMKGISHSGMISKMEKSSLSHVITGEGLASLFNIVKEEKRVQLGKGKLDVILTNTCTFLPSPTHPNLNSTIKIGQNKSKVLKSQVSSKVREVSFSESANQNNLKNVMEVKCLPQRKKKCEENIVNVRDIMDLIRRKQSSFKHLLHEKELWQNHKNQKKITECNNKSSPDTVQNKQWDSIPSSPHLEWDTKVNEIYKQGITRFCLPSLTFQEVSGEKRINKEPNAAILSNMKRTKHSPQKDRVGMAPEKITQSERIPVGLEQSSAVCRLQLNTEEEKRVEEDKQGEIQSEFSISFPPYSEVDVKVKGEAMQMKARLCLLQPKLQETSARDEITCNMSASSPTSNSVIVATEKIMQKGGENVKMEEVILSKKKKPSVLQEIQIEKKDQEKQNVVLASSNDWVPSSHLKLDLKVEKTNYVTEAMKYSLPELACKILSDAVRRAIKKSIKDNITSGTKNVKEYVLPKEDKIKLLAKKDLIYTKDKDLKGNKEQWKLDSQSEKQAKTDGEGIKQEKRDGNYQEEMDGEGGEQGKVDQVLGKIELQGQKQDKIHGNGKEGEEWNQEDKEQGQVDAQSKGQKKTDPEVKLQGKKDIEDQGLGKGGSGSKNAEIVMYAHFHFAPSQINGQLDTRMKGENIQGISRYALSQSYHQKLGDAGKVVPTTFIGSNDTKTAQVCRPQKEGGGGKTACKKHGRHAASVISKVNQIPLPSVPCISRHSGFRTSEKTNVNTNLGHVSKRKTKQGEVLTLPSFSCGKLDKGQKVKEDKQVLTRTILPCTRNLESLSLEKLKYILSPLTDIFRSSKRTKNTIKIVKGEMESRIIKSCLSQLMLPKSLPTRQTSSIKTIARQMEKGKASLPPEEDGVQTLDTDSQTNTSTCPFMSFINQYSILSKRKEPQRSSKEKIGQDQERIKDPNVILSKMDSSLFCPLQAKLLGSSREVSYPDVNLSISSHSLTVKVNELKPCEEAKDEVKCGILCQRTMLRVKISPPAHISKRNIFPLSIKEQRKGVQVAKSNPRMVLKKSSSLPSLSCFKWISRVNVKEDLLGRTQFCFPSLILQGAPESDKKVDTESVESLLGNSKELIQHATQEEENEHLLMDLKDFLDPTIRKLLYAHIVSTEELQRKIKEQKRKMQEHKSELISVLEDRIKKSSFTQFQCKQSSDTVTITCLETDDDGDLANDLQEKNGEKVANMNNIVGSTDKCLKTKELPLLKTCNFSSLQWKTREQEGKIQEGKSEPDLMLTKISTAGCHLPFLSMSAGMEENRRLISTRSALSIAQFLEPPGCDSDAYLKPVSDDVLINLQCGKQQMPENKEEDGDPTGDTPESPRYQEMKGQERQEEASVHTKSVTSLLFLPPLSLERKIGLDDGMLRLTRSLQRISEAEETTLLETIGGDGMKGVAKQYMFPKGTTARKETVRERCPDIIMKGRKSLPSCKLHRTELHVDIKSHKGKEHDRILRKTPPKSSLPSRQRDVSTQVDEEKIRSKTSLLPLMLPAFSDLERTADTEAVCGNGRKGKPYRAGKEGEVGVTAADVTIRVHCKGPTSSPIPHILNAEGFTLNVKVQEKKVHPHKDEPHVILSKTFLYTPLSSLSHLDSGDSIDKDMGGVAGSSSPQLHFQESPDVKGTANRELVEGNRRKVVTRPEQNVVLRKETEQQWVSDLMVKTQQRREPSQVRSEGDLHPHDDKMYFTGFGTLRHGRLLELHLMGQQEVEPGKYKKKHVATFDPYPTTGNLERQTDAIENSKQKLSPKVLVSLPRQTAKGMCVAVGTSVNFKGFSAAKRETHQQETLPKLSPESVSSFKFYNLKKDGRSSNKITKMFSPQKLGSLETNATKLITPQKPEKRDTITEKHIVLHSKSGHKTRSNATVSVKFPFRDRKQETTLEIDVDRKTTVYTSLPILPGLHMDITECNALRRKENVKLPNPEQEAQVVELLQKSLKPLWTFLLQSGHLEEIKKETNNITTINLQQQKQIETQIVIDKENCPHQQTQGKEQKLSGTKENLQVQKPLQRNAVDSFCASTPLSLKRQNERSTSLKTEPWPNKKTAKHPVSQTVGIAGHSTPTNKIEYSFKRTKNMVLWNKNSPRIVIRNLSISMRTPHTEELETNPGSEQRACLSKFKEESVDMSKIKRDTLTAAKENQSIANTVLQHSQPIVVNEQEKQQLPQVKEEANLKSKGSKNKLTPQTEEKIAPEQGDRILKKLNLHIIEQKNKIPRCILMHTDQKTIGEVHLKKTMSINIPPVRARESQDETPLFKTREHTLLPKERDASGPTQSIHQPEAVPGALPNPPPVQSAEIKTPADGAGAECSLAIYEAIRTLCQSQVKTRIQDKVSSDKLEELQDYEPDDMTSLPSPHSSLASPATPDPRPKAILQYFTLKEKNKLTDSLHSKALEIKLNLIPEKAKVSFQKFSFYSKEHVFEDNSWALNLNLENLSVRSSGAVDTIKLDLEENYLQEYPLHSCVETGMAHTVCGRQLTPMPSTIPQPDSGTCSKLPACDSPVALILQSYSTKQIEKLLMHLSVKTLEIQMKAPSGIVRESYAMANARDGKRPSSGICIHSAAKVPKRKNRILLLFEEKSLHQIDLDLQYRYLRFLGLSVESMFCKPNALSNRPLKLHTTSKCKQVDESSEPCVPSSESQLLKQQVSFNKKSPHVNSLLFRKVLEPVRKCAFPPGLCKVLRKDTSTRTPSRLRSCLAPEKDKRHNVRFQEPSTHKPLDLRTQKNAGGVEDARPTQISKTFSNRMYTESPAELEEWSTSRASEDEECTFLAGTLTKESQNIIFKLQKDIPLGNFYEMKQTAYLKPFTGDVSDHRPETASRKRTSVMSTPPHGSHKSRKHRSSSKFLSPDRLCHCAPDTVEIHSVLSSVPRNEEKLSWTTSSTTTSSSAPSSKSDIQLHSGKKPPTSHTHPESKERKKTALGVLRKHHPHITEKHTGRNKAHDYESERMISSQSKHRPATKLHHRDINFSSEKLEQPFFYACMPADTLEIVPQTVRWTIPSSTLRKRNFKVPLVAKIATSWKIWGSPK
ncbi:leucine-rich repeat transmembrane protein CCDC168 [Thomomys bottae]